MKLRTSSLRSLVFCSVLLAAPALHATTVTWNAGTAVSTDGLWSTATNWSGDTAPVNDDDLVFDGTDNPANSNDIPLTSINSLTLNNAGWNITLGTLTVGGGITANGTAALGGTLTLGAAQNWSNSIDTLTVTGSVANGGNLLTVGGAGNTAVSAAINDAGGLAKNGAGTLTLSGNNGYTGNTTISAGVLNIQNANALGGIGSGTSVTSGAALEIQNAITTAAEPLTLDGSGISNGGALRNISGINKYAGPVTLGGASRINSDANTLTLDVASGNAIVGTNQNITFGGAADITVSDPIATGSGTVTKDGAGRLTLSGANTYSGITTISQGALRITGSAAALGSTSGGTTVASGAALETAGANTYNAEPLILNGTGISNDGALRNNNGTASWTGPITLNSDSRIQSTAGTFTLNVASGNAIEGVDTDITFGAIGTIVVSDPISIGSGSMTKEGSGTLQLNTANTFTGGVFINAGILRLNITGTLGGNAVTFGPGSTAKMQIWATVSNQTIANLNTDPVTPGTPIIENGANAGGNPSTLTVGDSQNLSGTYAGIFQNGASQTLSLVKAGTGTLTLTNASNTYTGTTTINAGTLALGSSASIATSSSLTIGAAGNFDTSAKTTYSVPATQPIAFGLDAAGAGSSGKIAAASLDISSAVVSFNIDNGQLDDPQYVIATYSGTLTGTFAAAPPTGYAYDYGTGTNSQIKLVPVGGGSEYENWADGALFGDDANGDGVKNGLAWILGADNPNVSALDKLPLVSTPTGYLQLDFTRENPYAPAKLYVEYGNDLIGWTKLELPSDLGPSTIGGDIEVTVTEGPPDAIQVKIPTSTHAAGGKLFARLSAEEN